MSAYLETEARLKAMEKRASELVKNTPAQFLNLQQMILLERLYKLDCQRPTDLAKYMGQPPTSFTPILDRLEIRSLIARVADTEDRRAVKIVLTGTGKKAALVNAITATLEKIEAEFKE